MFDELSDKSWYVIQAYTGFEEDVKKTIYQKAKENNLEKKFGEIIIPTTEVEQSRKGKVQKINKRYMPGYVFVEMELNKITENLVKSIPRVAKFIGAGREPVAVSISEIRSLKKQMVDGEKVAKQSEVFRRGDTVKVNEGPFANFTGEVAEVNGEKKILKVMVSIFGRQTSLELTFSQVEHT